MATISLELIHAKKKKIALKLQSEHILKLKMIKFIFLIISGHDQII